MLDLFGQSIDLWNIIFVVSSNCKLEIALVVSQIEEDDEILPIISFFNLDGTLRSREIVFRRQAVIAFTEYLPEQYNNTRKEYMEKYCD